MSETTESVVPDDYVLDDVQAMAEYRSVSALALLSAVLGVCSLAALVNDGLLVIPLLGTICAILALRRIAASEGQLAGRTPALVGLSLSLVLGVGIYAHRMTTERLVAAEAQKWALDWCDLLLAGKTLVALELQNPPTSRRPFDDSLADYYETNDGAARALEKFRTTEVIARLLDAPEGARVVPGESLGVAPDERGGFRLAQRFQLIAPGTETNPTVFTLWLTRSRVADADNGGWYVTDQALVE